MNLVQDLTVTIDRYFHELTLQFEGCLEFLSQQLHELPQILWQSYCQFMTSLVETYGEGPTAWEPLRKQQEVAKYIPPGGYWVIRKFDFV